MVILIIIITVVFYILVKRFIRSGKNGQKIHERLVRS